MYAEGGRGECGMEKNRERRLAKQKRLREDVRGSGGEMYLLDDWGTFKSYCSQKKGQEKVGDEHDEKKNGSRGRQKGHLDHTKEEGKRSGEQ